MNDSLKTSGDTLNMFMIIAVRIKTEINPATQLHNVLLYMIVPQTSLFKYVGFVVVKSCVFHPELHNCTYIIQGQEESFN